jgi:hypothetical protein
VVFPVPFFQPTYFAVHHLLSLLQYFHCLFNLIVVSDHFIYRFDQFFKLWAYIQNSILISSIYCLWVSDKLLINFLSFSWFRTCVKIWSIFPQSTGDPGFS